MGSNWSLWGTLIGVSAGLPLGIGAAVTSAAIGGTVGAHEDEKERMRERESQVSYAPQTDYSAVMQVMSDNNKTVELGQIQSQEFSLQQAAMDHELQHAANTELGLEKFDTSLQAAKLDYFHGMRAEQDRHMERIAQWQNVRLKADAAAASAAVPEPVASDFLNDK